MSIIKDFSIGIVVENKPRSTDTIMVALIDYFPGLDGELRALTNEVEVEGTDQYGRKYTSKLANENHIIAKWYRGESLHATSPDVRRGERVQIKRLADTDQFFWTLLGVDNDKNRRLGAVTTAVNNNPDYAKNNTGTEEDNYIQEVNTYEKRVILTKTSKSNGEKFAYNISVDSNKGTVLITDDADNTIFLNSGEKQLLLRNTDGSFIEINKKIINMKAIEYINMEAGKDINIKAGENINTKVGKNMNWEIGLNFNSNIGKSINSSSGTSVTFKASSTVDLEAGGSVNATAPLIGENGNIVQNRGVGGGTATFPGTIKVTQEVEVAGIRFTQHKHNETQSVTSKPIN